MLKNLFVIHSKIFQRCLLQLHMRSDSETLAPSDKPLHGFTSWRCSTSLYLIFRAPGWDGWDPQDAGQLNSLDGINIPLPSLLLSFNFKFTFRLCLVLFFHTIFIFPLICLLRKSLKVQCFVVVRSPDFLLYWYVYVTFSICIILIVACSHWMIGLDLLGWDGLSDVGRNHCERIKQH